MKRLFLIVPTLLQAVIVFGQQNKIDIGIEGSPSIIYLRGNNFAKDNHYPNIGFSGGLFFQYNFPKTFSLRTNIGFERKGALTNALIKDKNGEVIAEYAPPNNFDYLTSPIFIRATFGRKVKYFVNAGTFFGCLMKQTIVYSDLTQGNTKHSKYTSDNTNLYKRFDTGITAGFGMLVTFKKKFAISFEIRNNLGMVNVLKYPDINNEAIKTNSTNLLIGFTYKLDSQKTSIN